MKKNIRILNNNAIIAIDDKNNEVILVGKGIGFQNKVGDTIDESTIENEFVKSNTTYKKISNLFEKISHQYIAVVNEIVKYAEQKLNKKIKDDIYFNLLSHCQFAVERSLREIPIINNMFYEVKKFYKLEYEIGLKAIELLNSQFSINLNEEEASLIAIHLIDIGFEHDLSKVIKMTETIDAILKIVKYNLGIEKTKHNEYDFDRLISHLREFIMNKIYSSKIDSEDYNDFKEEYEMLLAKHEDIFKCVREIKNFIEYVSDYKLHLNDEFYLFIHIKKMKHHSE